MMPFKRVKPEELSVNPFTVIGKTGFSSQRELRRNAIP